MIHPSYYELMEKINKDNDAEDTPVITSRYSIILATSKRARQLIDGAPAKVKIDSEKPLSAAVSEIYQGKVSIVSEDKAAEDAQRAEEERIEREKAENVAEIMAIAERLRNGEEPKEDPEKKQARNVSKVLANTQYYQ
mgnify:CR=1 FL=1